MTPPRTRILRSLAALLGLVVTLLCPALHAVDAGEITVDFRSMGTFFTDELVVGDLTVRNQSPLGPISILNFNGLGTYYTRLQRHFYVQIDDEVEFDFSAAGGVTDLTLQFSGSQGPNSYTVELDRYYVGISDPVTVGYGGGSLIRHIGQPQLPPLERLVLRPTGSTVRVGSISYITAPEPGAFALLVMGLFLLLPCSPRSLRGHRKWRPVE